MLIEQFSDEFNLDGRTFFQEDDPYLQAVDIWYGVTQDLEVRISLVSFKKKKSHKLINAVV